MTREQFTALGEAEARAHLAAVRRENRWSESDQLVGAWWTAHGQALDTAEQPRPEDAAGTGRTRGERSGMLLFGRMLFVVGALGVVLCGFVAIGDLAASDLRAGPWLFWASLFGSASGLGGVFWAAGVLEQRLIEIRDELAGWRGPEAASAKGRRGPV